ncbi:MAG: serine/threonine protein kinase [Gammaproteobacteria bacterium]|nr:MAG: serine/threonine protein kinase [Gammaproteobacteria bacterium]RLA22973.1 MAG: serine/threonine protein kinase [Gammaproteobacteria bacterium]
MTSELRFDGKVAVVTGSGGGLGRSHALLLASRGAKVVINDLGGDLAGRESLGNKRAADLVVDEIRAAGGEAVANYDSVLDGDKIIQTALDNWGRIDILVNNAGILRDTTFHKMTEDDWDQIYNVHVKGAFKTTHAAWPYMREQEYGRIVFTASSAGIYGNFGQANYSMAKLALFGFAQSLALEGEKRNIRVNTIAPFAGSRMTETILEKQMVEALNPSFVSPTVGYLCHDEAPTNGSLFEVGGGWTAQLRWERAKGVLLPLNKGITLEDIQNSWGKITDFSDAEHPEGVMGGFDIIAPNLKTL